jgi:predicted AlkP superfamily pyrophosphatase or phosphodiesterase
MRGLICLLVIFIFHFSVFAQKSNPSTTISKPKLVVGIVIDQMRWDYLYKFYSRYSENGFKKIMNQGFSNDNTLIPYTPTVTAAGHACIYTGSVPAFHGIMANDWIERETETFMYCVRDTSVRSVGTMNKWQGEMSPRNLLTNTIGDELKMATNFKSKVIGIALKDRGAILPAGHFADNAYWFDDSTGGWITSTYYGKDLKDWVKKYNSKRLPDVFVKNDWTLMYPESTYTQSTKDDNWFEKVVEIDNSRTFPHKYQNVTATKNYYSFRVSPFANTYTFDFAKETIKNEQLGKQGTTDMLCVSLSATDYLGHRFGPNSLEMEDTYLRLDKDLADFFSYLDQQYGKNNYLLFMTADHGSPQIGNYLNEISGDRNYAAGAYNNNDLVSELNKSCKSKFGSNKLVQKIYDYHLYLNMLVADSLKISRKELKAFIVSELKKRPLVMNAYDIDDFNTVILPDVLRKKLSNSYYFRRSGDVQYFYKPQYTDYTKDGLEHGAWYPYDSHIPLLWYGWGIKKGRSRKEVYMTDIAPTVAALLNIQMPNGCVGKVIEEVLK